MRMQSPAPKAWYRQPVLWLGALVLFGSLLGCAILIVAGARYADPALPDTGHAVFKVPVAHPAAPPPAPKP